MDNETTLTSGTIFEPFPGVAIWFPVDAPDFVHAALEQSNWEITAALADGTIINVNFQMLPRRVLKPFSFDDLVPNPTDYDEIKCARVLQSDQWLKVIPWGKYQDGYKITHLSTFEEVAKYHTKWLAKRGILGKKS